jgi:serine/threonine-protein kinase mTOR
MLKHLNSQFDPFISRYENLLMLFNCMQDQNFEIREWTVRILGRLVPHNASQILPYLRQLIVSLISQLEQSNDGREREEAVKLIKMFVRYTPDLAKAYSTSILICLIKKLDGERATSTLVSSILTVISEISKINADAIKPYLGDLFPLILECIKDMTSSTKRKEAIRTLISIIENTSFVVKPYFYFPVLIEVIQNLVQTESNSDIRKHILRLIGTLGAVDPYLVKQITRTSEHADVNDVTEIFYSLSTVFSFDENDKGMNNIRKVKKQDEAVEKQSKKPQSKTLVTVEELNLSKEHKYSAMAIYQLMKVLVDPNMRDHHLVTLNGLLYILRCQRECMPYIQMIIPPLMDLIKQNDVYRM